MLVLDKKIRDINVFKGVFNMISQEIGDELLLWTDLKFFETKGKNVPFKLRLDEVNESVVMITFDKVIKKIGDNEIDTSLLIIYDLENDNDGGESFEKIMAKYSLQWTPSFWHDAFIEALQYLRDTGHLKGYVPPAKPIVEYEDDYEDYSQDDLDDFLNDFEEYEEDYDEEETEDEDY